MRTLIYTVTPQDAGRAVRSVVPRRFALGTHIFRRLKVQGGVLVNGETARASRVLHTGDVVTLLLPDGAHHAERPAVRIGKNKDLRGKSPLHCS